MKYPRENILDPRNAHKKKIWTHEIHTRKYFGPTKYPRGNILDPRKIIEFYIKLSENLNTYLKRYKSY